jgi:luciferase family oxidoreductase group 1
MQKVKLSALDLSVVTAGGNFENAIERTVAIAQHIEQLGFERLWLAEHHNMEHIASSATALMIGHVAGKTNTLRIGSGGIMLPNHSPLAVAEQFGTLDTLYPGRIDLGLGRAPGTDQATAMALRKNFANQHYDFGREIMELKGYFQNTDARARVRAFPGEGSHVPLWILGSSTDSAYLAAALGLPYAFAAHFAPAELMHAIGIYKQNFKPSDQLEQPYVMPCINVIAADTDAEANKLATSVFQMFLGIITNQRRPLQPPVDSMDGLWDLQAQAAVAQMTKYTFTGSKETLEQTLNAFVKVTGANELMVNTNVYDMEARLRSFSILNTVGFD